MIAAFHLLESGQLELGLNEIARASTLRIVDCLVEGTLITIFAGVVLRATRLRNSAARFAVWFATLVAIAAVPVFGFGLGGAAWAHGIIPAETLARPAVTVPGSWALYLFAAWAAIAGWAVLRVGRGLWHLHVLRQSCVSVNIEALDARVQQTIARSQAIRRVAFCTSDSVHVPTAIGLMKPVVVVPDWVMQELSPDELNQILLHELAHLRRWDDWTNLAQKIVKALFFFHPAVWWIEKKVSLEREMACDDAVLAETASPRAYAECLTHLAEKTLIQRSVALAQAALGRIRHTSLRVAQILDGNHPRAATRTSKPAVLLVAGFAIVCLVSVSASPRLIAFDDSETSRVATPVIATISPGVATETASHPKPTAGISNAKLQTQSAPWVQAKLSIRENVREGVRENHRNMQNSERAVTPSSEARADVRGINVQQTKVHYTDARLTDATSAAFTETFFVLVEGRENGSSDQPVYQIQMWRVTILRRAIDSNSTRIHPKQT